jgi:hypothetical protein
VCKFFPHVSHHGPKRRNVAGGKTIRTKLFEHPVDDTTTINALMEKNAL